MSQSRFCERCSTLDIPGRVQNLDLDAYFNPANTGVAGSEDTPVYHDSITSWYTVLREVVESAKITNCALCNLILKGWRQDIAADQERDRLGGGVINTGDFFAPLENAQQEWMFTSTQIRLLTRARIASDGSKNLSAFVQATCGHAHRSRRSNTKNAELQIVRAAVRADSDRNTEPSSGNVGVAAVLPGIIDPEPLSDVSIQIAKQWLQDCIQTHESTCNHQSTDQLPTRLIDVARDTGKVFLTITKEDKVSDTRFVALSHCWGTGGTPFITTKGSLESHREMILVADLPRTFRDSIMITRRLGLRYIWIDSLCIVQDDIHDWNMEAAQMARIYRDAHLVLNGARGESDSEGFLGKRIVKGLEMHSSSITNLPALALQLMPVDSAPWDRSTRPDPLRNEPVSKRAWCLQERWLPRRSLHYSHDQMIFECGKIEASEDGNTVTKDGDHVRDLVKSANIEENIFQAPNRGPDSKDDGYGGNEIWIKRQGVNWLGWHRMIEEYTARGITKRRDLLPAIAGLAREVSEASGGEYIAGLWKTGLVEGLMWHPLLRKTFSSPSDEYIAPSWSWASFNGPVQFPLYEMYIRERWNHGMDKQYFEPLASVISCEVVADGPDPYGRLKHGTLNLVAPGASVKAVMTRPNVEYPRHYFRSHFTDRIFSLVLPKEDQEVWLEGSFDGEYSECNTSALVIVFLVRTQNDREYRLGLVLQKLPHGNVFRRVGWVSSRPLTMNNSVPTEGTDECDVSQRRILKAAELLGDGDKESVESTDVDSPRPDPLGFERVAFSII